MFFRSSRRSVSSSSKRKRLSVGIDIYRIAKALIFSLFVAALPGHAKRVFKQSDEPLWEGGAFAAGLYFPDYPASDQQRFRYVLFPYVIYRGKIFKADDRDGARANVIQKERWQTDLSLGASFPANSEENNAREGMPDLDWLGEIGPRAVITLYERPDDIRFRLSLPVRTVFSTDFRSYRYRGLRFPVNISYSNALEKNRAWEFFTSLTINLADRKLNSYFYQVDPEYQNINRKAYRAKAGYVGSDLFLGLFRRTKKWRVFTGLSFDIHHEAANEDSPLFRRKLNVTPFIGIASIFLESDRKGYE